MADLTITAANVLAGSGAKSEDGTGGATMTAGEVVYTDSSDSQYKLADANGAAALAVVTGILLNGVSASQPAKIHTYGPITIGATVVPGVPYFLSKTPGKIAVLADIATSGDKVVFLGMGMSTTQIDFKPLNNTGSVVP